jgi:hypothetical protein
VQNWVWCKPGAVPVPALGRQSTTPSAAYVDNMWWSATPIRSLHRVDFSILPLRSFPSYVPGISTLLSAAGIITSSAIPLTPPRTTVWLKCSPVGPTYPGRSPILPETFSYSSTTIRSPDRSVTAPRWHYGFPAHAYSNSCAFAP